MKKLVFLVCGFIAITSCKKDVEEGTGYISFRTINHLTGEGEGNVPFEIKVGYSMRDGYGLSASTNEYGNYFGIYKTYNNDPYHLIVDANTNSYLFNGTNDVSLTYDSVNVVTMEVLPIGKFKYTVDCSGGGMVGGNLTWEMVTPLPSSSTLQSTSAAQSHAGSIYCGNISSSFSLVASDWVVTYSRRQTSSDPWEIVSDTITINYNETYEYTVVY